MPIISLLYGGVFFPEKIKHHLLFCFDNFLFYENFVDVFCTGNRCKSLTSFYNCNDCEFSLTRSTFLETLEWFRTALQLGKFEQTAF